GPRGAGAPCRRLRRLPRARRAPHPRCRLRARVHAPYLPPLLSQGALCRARDQRLSLPEIRLAARLGRGLARRRPLRHRRLLRRAAIPRSARGRARARQSRAPQPRPSPFQRAHPRGLALPLRQDPHRPRRAPPPRRLVSPPPPPPLRRGRRRPLGPPRRAGDALVAGVRAGALSGAFPKSAVSHHPETSRRRPWRSVIQRIRGRFRARSRNKGSIPMATKILGICGSLRKQSFNLMALKAAQALVPADTSLDVYDIAGLP